MILADAINAWTYSHKTEGVRVSDATYQIQVAYRTKLRAAERFVLADDAVRLICHLAHQRDRLEGWSFLARLPYSPIFIELDLHVKVREFEKMGTLRSPFKPNEVARRIAYLMWRDTTDTTDTTNDHSRWICHGFSEESTGKWVLPEIIAYVFDPEGGSMFPTRGSDFWNVPTLSLIKEFPKLPIKIEAPNGSVESSVDPELILGGLFDAAHKVIPYVKTDDGRMIAEGIVQGPAWLSHRMAAIINPWWDRHITSDQIKHNLVLSQVRENAGHLRWIITMLAAINGIPKTIRPLPVKTQRRSLGAHRLKYFSSSVVELTIPAEDQISYARSKLNRSSSNVHRPWHKVRGHWRVVEYGRVKYMCRHDPVMVEHGLGICSKCELLVRWINDFVQGTPEEGIHQHSHYEVKT